MTAQLHLGDCLDVMRGMPDACVDAVVTDPPYGLAFMGKQWDRGVPGVEFWAEALRVAKPGAHLLAFGGTRTFHRLACAIEDAGWQIKDCLSWLYGSGFPKHKTLLKPAWEPVVMAAKAGARVVNVDACRLPIADTGGVWGTSNVTVRRDRSFNASPGMGEYRSEKHPLGRWPANVCLDEEAAAVLDAQSGQSVSRIGTPRASSAPGNGYGMTHTGAEYSDSGGASRFFFVAKGDQCGHVSTAGLSSSQSSRPGDSARSDAATPDSQEGRQRDPSRVGPAFTSESESFIRSRNHASTAEEAERIGTTPTTQTCCESNGCAHHAIGAAINRDDAERAADVSVQVSGTRFLYTPKASRSEREAGLREAGLREAVGIRQIGPRDSESRKTDPRLCTHPTVKPVTLMRWLVRLVTPPDGVALDPFMGSGTTGIACVREGRSFIGIEREPEYFSISEARIAHARGETPADAEQPALDFGVSA